MKTSNKIILIYTVVISILSIFCLIDNVIQYKKSVPQALKLLSDIASTQVETVRFAKPEVQTRNGKLFYWDSGPVFMILYFTPTSDNIYMEGNTLNIASREYFSINFPYPVSAFEEGEPYPVREYQP